MAAARSDEILVVRVLFNSENPYCHIVIREPNVNQISEISCGLVRDWNSKLPVSPKNLVLLLLIFPLPVHRKIDARSQLEPHIVLKFADYKIVSGGDRHLFELDGGLFYDRIILVRSGYITYWFFHQYNKVTKRLDTMIGDGVIPVPYCLNRFEYNYGHVINAVKAAIYGRQPVPI